MNNGTKKRKNNKNLNPKQSVWKKDLILEKDVKNWLRKTTSKCLDKKKSTNLFKVPKMKFSKP